jgi:hypothetical protein
MNNKIELIDLKIGDKVWHGCFSGFCDNSCVSVINVEKSGSLKIITVLIDRFENKSQRFESQSGTALEPPTAYRIMPINQDTELYKRM